MLVRPSSKLEHGPTGSKYLVSHSRANGPDLATKLDRTETKLDLSQKAENRLPATDGLLVIVAWAISIDRGLLMGTALTHARLVLYDTTPIYLPYNYEITIKIILNAFYIINCTDLSRS